MSGETQEYDGGTQDPSGGWGEHWLQGRLSAYLALWCFVCIAMNVYGVCMCVPMCTEDRGGLGYFLLWVCLIFLKQSLSVSLELAVFQLGW